MLGKGSRLSNATPFSSTGITSRGRIGIDAALTGRALTNPWFTDPIDKESLIAGINELVGSIKHGQFSSQTHAPVS